MALQNRVTPFGEIVAIPERGTMMGNRGGRLHLNDRQELEARRWASRQWITCLLEFKGRHREVMSPNRYTELFFLDEATAFSAGHRPCAECRRPDFLAFVTAWDRAHAPTPGVGHRSRASEMDAVLQTERVEPNREKVTFTASLGELPTGTFVNIDGLAWLVRDGLILPWSPAGYGRPRTLEPASSAAVLTPQSIVDAFRHGYKPLLHPSAFTRE